MTNREKFKRVFGDIPAQKIFDSQWWDMEYEYPKGCTLCGMCEHLKKGAHTPYYCEYSFKQKRWNSWACKKFKMKGEDHGNES